MNNVLYAIDHDLAYLQHDGKAGMKWHTHKFGKWQSHAVYAQGMVNPDLKTRLKALGDARITDETWKRMGQSLSSSARRTGDAVTRFAKYAAKRGVNAVSNATSSAVGSVKRGVSSSVNKVSSDVKMSRLNRKALRNEVKYLSGGYKNILASNKAAVKTLKKEYSSANKARGLALKNFKATKKETAALRKEYKDDKKEYKSNKSDAKKGFYDSRALQDSSRRMADSKKDLKLNKARLKSDKYLKESTKARAKEAKEKYESTKKTLADVNRAAKDATIDAIMNSKRSGGWNSLSRAKNSMNYYSRHPDKLNNAFSNVLTKTGAGKRKMSSTYQQSYVKVYNDLVERANNLKLS